VDTPDYLDCKPVTALEREAAIALGACLQKLKWPGDRFPVELRFNFEITRAGSSALKVTRTTAPIAGSAKVGFNHWYLVSKPADFFRFVIPAEAAQVDLQRRAMEEGRIVPDYGSEWARTYSGITDAPPQSPAELQERFDNRPLRLMKKQIPVRCDCPLPAGFQVYGGKPEKLDAGEAACRECGGKLRRAGEADYPPTISQSMAYLRHAVSRTGARGR